MLGELRGAGPTSPRAGSIAHGRRRRPLFDGVIDRRGGQTAGPLPGLERRAGAGCASRDTSPAAACGSREPCCEAPRSGRGLGQELRPRALVWPTPTRLPASLSDARRRRRRRIASRRRVRSTSLHICKSQLSRRRGLWSSHPSHIRFVVFMSLETRAPRLAGGSNPRGRVRVSRDARHPPPTANTG